jgi:hypothetical protein
MLKRNAQDARWLPLAVLVAANLFLGTLIVRTAVAENDSAMACVQGGKPCFCTTEKLCSPSGTGVGCIVGASCPS